MHTLEEVAARRVKADAAIDEALARIVRGDEVPDFRSLIEERQVCDAAYFEAVYAVIDAAQPPAASSTVE